MDDISKRLWEKHDNANDHPPRRAMDAALNQIEREKVDATHVIVIMEYRDERGGGQRIFQAGKATEYETIGMLERAKRVLLDDM